jgi:hypothetical protein
VVSHTKHCLSRSHCPPCAEQNNFSKLTRYIICGVDVTLADYRRTQRFEKLHSVDLNSLLLLEAGFEQLLQGQQPQTVAVRDVISVQTTSRETVQSALELPWGQVQGQVQGTKRPRSHQWPAQADVRRPPRLSSACASSPKYAEEEHSQDDIESQHALPVLGYTPLQRSHLGGSPSLMPSPKTAALSAAAMDQDVAASAPAEHSKVAAAAMVQAAAVAGHRPCAQDVAAALRVVTILEALLGQQEALNRLRAASK